MAYSPGKRLEFERSVLAYNVQPMLRAEPRRASGRLLRVLAFTTFIIALGGLGAVAVFRGGFFGTERRDIERFSTVFIRGLAAKDGAQALEACVESPHGAELLHAEEGDIFGSASTASDANEQLNVLKTVHAGLQESGVNWSDVTPLAFGGIRARVQGNGMKRPLTALTGDLYFKSGNGVYAVEISAWRCNGQYVIVDVWKGYPVQSDASGLKAVAAKRFEQYEQEQSDSPSLELSYEKSVFVQF